MRVVSGRRKGGGGEVQEEHDEGACLRKEGGREGGPVRYEEEDNTIWQGVVTVCSTQEPPSPSPLPPFLPPSVHPQKPASLARKARRDRIAPFVLEARMRRKGRRKGRKKGGWRRGGSLRRCVYV